MSERSMLETARSLVGNVSRLSAQSGKLAPQQDAKLALATACVEAVLAAYEGRRNDGIGEWLVDELAKAYERVEEAHQRCLNKGHRFSAEELFWTLSLMGKEWKEQAYEEMVAAGGSFDEDATRDEILEEGR